MTPNSKTTIFHHLLTQPTIRASCRRASGSRRSPFPPSLRPTTGRSSLSIPTRGAPRGSPVQSPRQIAITRLRSSQPARQRSEFSGSGRRRNASSLAILCRAGRTELVISTTGSWNQAAAGEVKVAYRINEEPSITALEDRQDGEKSPLPGRRRSLPAVNAGWRSDFVKVYAGNAPRRSGAR